jgi:hypothetical protein
MNAADEGACGVLGLGAGGVALTTAGSTAGRGRERRGSDETSIGGFAVTSDTVVVRAVTAAATPQPERSSTAAAVPNAARVRIIEVPPIHTVD